MMTVGAQGILDAVTQFTIVKDSVVLNFGKHKGKSLEHIFLYDPWYFDQIATYRSLPLTIKFEMQRLENQAKTGDEYQSLRF